MQGVEWLEMPTYATPLIAIAYRLGRGVGHSRIPLAAIESHLRFAVVYPRGLLLAALALHDCADHDSHRPGRVGWFNR
jgi:hypothetical protein